jgi:ADP-heptose:LPS heptosyltransferase
MTRSFYSLLEPIGIGEVPEIKLPSIACEKSDISCVENILHQKGIKKEEILVIMHTGTSENFTERRWPAEYYADLADRLIEAFGVKIAFTGIKDEIPYIEEARKGIKNVGSTIDLGGDLSFGRYLSLISVSDLVISADTASVHLAACFSVPVAGLYGPNTPLLYGPWGGNGIWFYKKLACSPCITNYNSKLNRCRHPDGCGACMKKITVDEVFLAIRKNYFDTDAPFRIRKLHE